MDTSTFNDIVQHQIERSTSTLVKKAEEYATEDRLHNFKVAAEIQGITPRKALAGMLAKHTVSVFDMCASDESYSDAMWDEKITDHINYLILLRAIVEEEKGAEASKTVPRIDNKVISKARRYTGGRVMIESETDPWLQEENTSEPVDLSVFDPSKFPDGVFAPVNDNYSVEKEDGSTVFSDDLSAALALAAHLHTITGHTYEVWFTAAG